MITKTYVQCEVLCLLHGELVPLAVRYGGKRYEIDEITDTRRAASTKAGGAGIRYCVRLLGEMRYLWLEDIVYNKLPGAKWFITPID